MFVLTLVTDSIRVAPGDFSKRWGDVVAEEIDNKYANRVLRGVGLVICLHSVEGIGDASVFPGDGGAHTTGA
jgi:DNA-directed RNA polymerase III subunit RPC8